MSQVPDPTIAPADAAARAPWPAWKKAIAYAVFAALAVASTWFINLRVERFRPEKMQGASQGGTELRVPPK